MILRQDNLTWNLVGDDLVVLDLAGSVYLMLNGSGRVLWERLAQGCGEVELTSALVAEFEVSEDRAERDVAAFLAELEQRGLLDATR